MGIIGNSKSVKRINSGNREWKLDNNISTKDRILSQNQNEEEKIKKSLEKFWKINKEKLLSLSNDRIETNNLSTNNNNLSSLNNNITTNSGHEIKTKLIKKTNVLFNKKKKFGDNLRNKNLDSNTSNELPIIPLFNNQEKKNFVKYSSRKRTRKIRKKI